MGGGGSHTVTTSVPQPVQNQIPPELQPLISSSSGQTIAAQQTPGAQLGPLFNPNPQQIPGLTADQMATINSITGLPNTNVGTQGLTEPQLAALGSLNQFTAGPIGSAPATQAEEEAWKSFVMPQVEQEASLQGNRFGGGELEAIANSASQAVVPFLQAEATNRMAAAGAEAGIGSTQSNQLVTELQNALQAAGLPYNIAAQQAQAQYEDFLRRQSLAEEVNLGPIMTVMPNLIAPTGGQTSGTTTPTGGLFGSVICTELRRQGRLDDATWEADTRFAATMDAAVVIGYRRWATPVVRAMRRSAVVTAIVAWAAIPWTQEMAYRMGAREEGHWGGRVLMAVGVPFCRWVGRGCLAEERA